MQNFDSLYGTNSRIRLANLRKESARINAAPYRKNSPVTTWRDARYSRMNSNNSAARGFNGNSPVLYAFSVSALPGRFVRELRVGYYSDLDGMETARGIVVAIPHGKYLAGYTLSENGEYVIYLDCIYSNDNDCASAADSIAERIAENERDYAEKFRAMSDAENELDEKRAEVCELFPARNVSARLRDRVRHAIEQFRNTRDVFNLARDAYERG